MKNAVVLNNGKAVANNSGAMEQRPLKNNGRKSKSHTSRLNFSLLMCASLIVGIIVFSGCEDDPSKLGKKMGQEICECAKIKNEEKQENCFNKVRIKVEKIEEKQEKAGTKEAFEEAFEREFMKCENLF